MSRESAINCILEILHDADCDIETINKFIELEKASNYKEQLCLLSGFRKKLLQSIHGYQSRLDCLDHLMYQIRANICKTNR